MPLLMVTAFMALGVPMLTAALVFAGTNVKASTVYMEKSREHYARAACYSVGDRTFDTSLNGYHVVWDGTDCQVSPE